MNRMAWIFFLGLGILFAQDSVQKVTYEMGVLGKGPKLVKPDFGFKAWQNHQVFYFNSGNGIHRFEAQSGQHELIPHEQLPAALRHSKGHRSSDLKKVVWATSGNLYIEDQAGLRQLTDSKSEDQNPTLSPDGKKVAFTRESNLYVFDLASGLESQLTEDGTQLYMNGFSSWVYHEEIFGRRKKHKAFWWSPDSQNLAFMSFDDSQVDLFQIYRLGGPTGYWEQMRYPKPGRANPKAELKVIELKTRHVHVFDLVGDDENYIAFPVWHTDSSGLLVQWMNRGQDHLKIIHWDLTKQAVRPVYEEEQATWIDFFEDVQVLDDHSFIVRSRRDGYAHLYWYENDGELKRQLTSGNWRVQELLQVDSKRQRVFFYGDKGDSTSTFPMVVNLSGKGLRSLSAQPGTHGLALSPDASFAVHTHHDRETPSKAWLVSLAEEGQTKSSLLGSSANPEAAAFEKGRSEFFKIPTSDGYALPAWWLLPPDFDPSGGTIYPVIFRIYSGPDAASVRNGFPTRSMWRDHFYASQGVIIMTVDHRGSGHFGKKGADQMHRQLGKWEMHDLGEAVKWLRQKPFIDSTRVGITGFSYGGYMTLYALTRGGGLFTHGISGAPVTDWAYYDTVYSERYMDTPQENPEGYVESSIMTHADQLAGPILLLHGTADDNVHFQNSLELIYAWTSSEVQFEFMAYPESRHGVKQRRHLAELEYGFWKRHFGLPELKANP